MAERRGTCNSIRASLGVGAALEAEACREAATGGHEAWFKKNRQKYSQEIENLCAKSTQTRNIEKILYFVMNFIQNVG